MKKRRGPREIEPEYWDYIAQLGKRLKSIREAKGWTLEECEEKGYSSWRHLGFIELGRKNLTMTTLLRLSKLYKMKPEEIIKGLGVKKAKPD